MKNDKHSESLQLLHFQLQDMHACIELKNLKKILPLMELDKVPRTPPYFVGLLNYAGESIPVIDLAWRLALPRQKTYSLATPILLCDNGIDKAGLIVDEIYEIITIAKDQIQKQKEFTQSNSHFLGSVAIKNNFALLINCDLILKISYIEEKIHH